MTARELKKKYFDFFVKRGHKKLPNVSLVPEDVSSSALFISAGMHPLIPHLMGEAHPLGRRLASNQRCIRTGDIEEVGDLIHLTFFEMLGNWSLGDPKKPDGIGEGYWKEQQINWSHEFLTKELGISQKKISVTCFAGDKDAPKDEESARAWQKLGIPKDRIYFFGKKENWWGPVEETGPCGPDSEMFVDTEKKACGPKCDPSCQCGKYFEVWNDVFMEYNKTKEGKYEPLKQKNVDTGMGVERVLSVMQGVDDIFQITDFKPIIKRIEETSNKKYEGKNKEPMRIIADYLRASTFIIADGVEPGNKGREYVLRRLLRRAAVKMHQLRGGLTPISGFESICFEVIKTYQDEYFENVGKTRDLVGQIVNQEMEKFGHCLNRGLRKLEKASSEELRDPNLFAFDLYQTLGFPFEVAEELLKQKGKKVDKDKFEKIQKKHQELSRKAAEGMFKGGLADHSEEVTRLHTATHLLHQALREVLGDHVKQVGSNITPERLRFDFTHPKKLTEAEIEQIEKNVNQQIKANLPVEVEMMTVEEAEKRGALAFFGEKYGDKVKVYSVGNYSCEVCGGPHVKSTREIGGVKIVKEKPVGVGRRRIYAKLVDS